MKKIFFVLLVLSAFLIPQTDAHAILIGGVEFPQGAVSFADAVVSYNPTGGVNSPYNNPAAALGVPDYPASGSYVSLGDQGTLVLRFTDNSLTTSGDSGKDLWVFEIGGMIEPTRVDISTDGFNWIYVGQTNGATSGVDIDAYIGSGVVLWQKYSYVKLTDLLPHQSGSPYTGADIDAVGAISSAAPADVIPEPLTVLLLTMGVGGFFAVRQRKE